MCLSPCPQSRCYASHFLVNINLNGKSKYLEMAGEIGEMKSSKLGHYNKRILPLYIPSVLKNVLEYLPANDLKNCRLVSHQWAEEGGKLLAKQTSICFGDENEVESFLDDELQKKSTMKNSDSNSANGVNPVLLSTVRFKTFQFMIGHNWGDFHYTVKSPKCAMLFDDMGDCITGLELLRGVWQPKDLDDSFFAKLPNLEYLKLVGSVKEVPVTDSLIKPTSRCKEVAVSPSIKTFEVLIHPLDESPDYARSLIEILLLRMPNVSRIKGSLISKFAPEFSMWVVNAEAPLRCLSRLEVQVKWNESEITQLQKRNFPLTHLEMAINPGIRFPSLWKLLSSLGSTLKYLKLDLRILASHPDTFPCSKDMHKLKNLNLRWFDGSLKFLQDLTELQSLELEDCNLSSGFRDECDPHLGLKSFKTLNCNSSAGRFTFDTIYKNIVKYFPNLRVIKMDRLTDPSIRIICGGLPNLEELIAFQGIYTDEGLLGISPTLLEKGLSDDFNQDSSKELNDHDILKRGPNLTQLLKLRVLALESPRLTDATVKHGIVFCKEIKSLNLASPKITDDAVRAIVDNMDLYYLEFRMAYQLSRKMVCYAREKMKENGRLLFFCGNT